MTTIGVSVHDSLFTGDGASRRDLLQAVVDGGLDHVTVGDHVSFQDGIGFDGLLAATAVLSASDALSVLVGVYQLPLRHPMVVARQLASISQLAPGRLVFGVGVGGEDRLEVSNCGVDPATRGRRTDESLTVLAALATGDEVDHQGEFFTLERASVRPAPSPRVPVVIGGRGEVAVRRTVEHGDGWLGIFCTPRRFAATRVEVLEASEAAGRVVAPDFFGVNVWCGLDRSPDRAREHVATAMEDLYHRPWAEFEHLSASGTAEQVAERLAEFVAGGATQITVIPAAASPQAGVELAAEVGALLRGAAG
ncbi:LLM class flavin-dependent oxidoreductase [Geodermatophilaceae bacterium NBWT11]|nr:LLM class flavin-dependent oxidoreductase [Geodermatophilaceae bacterium NBWT11]